MPISAKAQFERRKLDKSKEHTGHLMVSVAGESKDYVRTPVSTILVLDVSGSMNGQCGGAYRSWNNWIPGSPYQIEQHVSYSSYSPRTKMDALKETARKLVEHLSHTDEVGLVTFSDVATIVYERQKVENKGAVYNAINSMYPMGSTNMSGGLLQAFKMINKEFKGVKRIMLLTDGLANVGVSDASGLIDLLGLRDGSTISTFGFGTDCNRMLLEGMAKAAGGNSYFIDNAEDLSNTFAKELGGMLSCVAQNIEVKITPNKGVKVDLILNNFTVEDLQGTALIKAEDVYVGENKKILIKMNLEKVPRAKPRAISLAHIEVSYDDLITKKRETIKLNAKVEYVKGTHADTEIILEIREQLAIIEAAKAQEKAVRLANAGDFVGARSVIQCSMPMLNDVSLAGSAMCTSAYNMTESMLDSFDASKYTASYGATVSNDVSNSLRSRAGTGGLSDLYSTKIQKDMVQSFANKSAEGTTINPPSPEIKQAVEQMKKDAEEAKSFAKKRKQQ